LIVGVYAERLRDKYPRGVTRVARAIADELTAYPDLKILALGDAEFHRNAMVFPATDLREWMATHPAALPNKEKGRGNKLKKLLRRLRLEKLATLVAAPLWKSRLDFWEAFAGMLKLLGVYDSIRLVYRKWRGLLGSAPPGEMKEYIAMHDLDVILSFEAFETIWGWPCEMYRTKMIAFYHDAIPFRIDEGPGWDPGLYFRVTGQMVARAHGICCNSEATRRDLETLFPHAAGATAITLLGHDIERFAHAETVDRSWIHERFKCRGKIITMIGVIETRKNQAGMFHACRFLGSQNPDERLTLLLIGHHPEGYPYKHLLKAAGQYVDVVETDYVADDELSKLLSASDVFVYPSYWEGFGIPVLEAMTAGVPVVCSDLSSLPEVGGDHVTYCDPYDPESIAAAIREVLNWSPEERTQRVAAAKKWAQQFTWERCTQGIYDEIRRVVADHPETESLELIRRTA
jgi:glycosyltransferase involved in cell wall biosynthesis